MGPLESRSEAGTAQLVISTSGWCNIESIFWATVVLEWSWGCATFWYPLFLPFHVISLRALVAGENALKYYFIAPTPTRIIEQEYVKLSHPWVTNPFTKNAKWGGLQMHLNNDNTFFFQTHLGANWVFPGCTSKAREKLHLFLWSCAIFSFPTFRFPRIRNLPIIGHFGWKWKYVCPPPPIIPRTGNFFRLCWENTVLCTFQSFEMSFPNGFGPIFNWSLVKKYVIFV